MSPESEITMANPLCVHADWDADASVWVATSHDVPGLATEAETVESLLRKLETMIPELLAANANAVLRQAGLPKAF